MNKSSPHLTDPFTKLPSGWTFARLGDIIVPTNKKLDPTRSSNHIFIGLEHIERNTGKIIGFGKSLDTKSMKTVFERGDILYGRLRPYLNKVCVPTFDGVCSTDILVFAKTPFVNSMYILLILLTDQFVQFARHHMQGVQHPRINYQTLSKYVIPLPPLSEQVRIVSKVEHILANLEHAITKLRATMVLLKQYNYSILKYAFEGKLTEKWQEAHPIESDSTTLLKKILEIREKNGPISNLAESISTLPPLPAGWSVINVKDIADNIQYGSSQKARYGTDGIPVLRMGNIRDGKITYEGVKYYPPDMYSITDFLLEDGDVLFNRTNSAKLVGKSAVYKAEYPKVAFASYIIRIKVNRQYYDPDFLSFYINSTYGRMYIASVVSQQVGQANVNGRKLLSMPIPLPPLLEQKIIIAEIQRLLSVSNNTQLAISKSVEESDRLWQTILKKASEGKLVAQDPNDESSEVLLEQIRQKEIIRSVDKDQSKKDNRKAGPKQMKLS